METSISVRPHQRTEASYGDAPDLRQPDQNAQLAWKYLFRSLGKEQDSEIDDTPDASQCQALRDLGLSLAQIGESTQAQRDKLLNADADHKDIYKALLGAGMSVEDTLTHGGTVISKEQARNSEFMKALGKRLGGGANGAAAIAGALYNDKITAEELEDSEFLRNLLFAKDLCAPAGQSQSIFDLVDALNYAKDHIDLFEAAEGVAVPGSATHNKWFANAGVFQLAGMKDDAQEWEQIEKTLGRTLSKDERNAAIKSAKGMKDNWATLCAKANDLGLELRKGTTDVIDFTKGGFDKLNVSPLIALLGNSDISYGGMNILSALDYLRNNVDLFEAAEKVAAPGSNADNGWFANAGVYKVCELKEDSKEWADIEKTMNRALTKEERKKAVKAAQSVVKNWDDLCAHAREIGGISLREGSTDVIDFKKDDLKNIHFNALSFLVPDLNVDRDAALKYARAKKLEAHLAKDGQPAKGATLDDLLKLAPNGIDNLLKLDPAKVRSLLDQGKSLQQISQLKPNELTKVGDMDPALVSWLQTMLGATLEQIAQLTTGQQADAQKAMLGGYRPAGAHEDFANIDIDIDSISNIIPLNSGTITFETKNGDKVMVSANTNPDLYNKVKGMLEARSKATIDAVRKEFGLPMTDESNIMEMTTNVLRNKDKPEEGCMTVGELTMKKLVDKYRALIDKGMIRKDDQRAQFVRAVDARAALGGGYSLLPYSESVQGDGSTYRTYPGGENDPTFQDMNPEDVERLLDEGKVNQRISELLQDPEVSGDYQTFLDEATATLPDKTGLGDKLYNAITSQSYTDALNALKAKGLTAEAERMTQQDLSSLAMIDPARAQEAAQKLMMNSLGVDFQALVDDPSKIDDATFEQAVRDAIRITIQALRSATGVIRHGTQSAAETIKYLETVLGDKKLTSDLAKVLKQSVIDAKNGKGPVGGITGFTNEQFEEAMNRTSLPLENRGGLRGFFGKTQKYGLWGTIGGGAAMASFGYKISKGAFAADSTAQERMGAARDLIAFLTVFNHTTRGLAKSIDETLNFFSKILGSGTEDAARAWKFGGLDYTLPEIWGKQNGSLIGDKLPWPWELKTPPDAPPTRVPPGGVPTDPKDLARALDDVLDENWSLYDTQTDRAVLTVDAPNAANVNSAADNVLQSIWKDKKPAFSKNFFHRIGVSAVKVLGALSDFGGGILDIVLGAIGLKKAIEQHDAGQIATSSLGIAGGVALTAGGLIGVASLFAKAAAGIAVAASPLLVVGTVLALAGFIAGMIVESIKRHNKLQDASDKQGEFFSDLAKDGLAYSDWGDRLEFLRYAFALYGNDNPDPSKSYFEYQKAEWEYFKSHPAKDGSSLNRMNKDLHVRNDKTWKTQWEDETNSHDYITS